MAVTKAQAGTYRQIAHRLRIHDATGASRDSERPRAGTRGNWRHYLDSDDEPTLLELREGDRVDIESLMRAGAIVPYQPPKRRAPRKGAADGEVGGA